MRPLRFIKGLYRKLMNKCLYCGRDLMWYNYGKAYDCYCRGGDRNMGWIKGAIKHKGALHEELGVPEGKNIPSKKLNMAAKKGGKEGERARLAKTLKRMKK